MKAPARLQSLIEEGLIDTVVRQLMSGKEAMVFVVRSGNNTICAKIYKEANNRSFRQAVDYTENRKVKNSRSARAMAKGSKFGRQEQEVAWQSAEVDALYRLAAAGVRVPQPYNFHDGVLLMELVTDAHGDAAPRLNDVAFTPAQALAHHATLIAEVVRMLCAGVVHGDLSEFNILLAHADDMDVPVIIDLPQAVDAAGNNHAQRMLLRDVANLRDFFGQFAPALLATDYGPEIWSLYQAGMLTNDTPLTGRYKRKHADVDMQAVLREIDDARAVLGAAGPALRDSFAGTFDVDFALRYEASDQTIRAYQLKVNSLKMTGLAPGPSALLEAYAPNLAQQALLEVVMHKLRPQDLQLADTMGLEPSTITVTDKGLVIGFVNKASR
jgi:RIO kinase 1